MRSDSGLYRSCCWRLLLCFVSRACFLFWFLRIAVFLFSFSSFFVVFIGVDPSVVFFDKLPLRLQRVRRLLLRYPVPVVLQQFLQRFPEVPHRLSPSLFLFGGGFFGDGVGRREVRWLL